LFANGSVIADVIFTDLLRHYLSTVSSSPTSGEQHRHGYRNTNRPSLHSLIVESVIGRSHLSRHVGTQPFDLTQSRLPSIRMWTVTGDRLDLVPRDLSGEHKIKLLGLMQD
jgi:hypothetical protein